MTTDPDSDRPEPCADGSHLWQLNLTEPWKAVCGRCGRTRTHRRVDAVDRPPRTPAPKRERRGAGINRATGKPWKRGVVG